MRKRFAYIYNAYARAIGRGSMRYKCGLTRSEARSGFESRPRRCVTPNWRPRRHGLRPQARRTTRGIEEPRTPGRKKCFGRKDGKREPVEDLVCGGTSLRRSPGNLG